MDFCLLSLNRKFCNEYSKYLKYLISKVSTKVYSRFAPANCNPKTFNDKRLRKCLFDKLISDKLIRNSKCNNLLSCVLEFDVQSERRHEREKILWQQTRDPKYVREISRVRSNSWLCTFHLRPFINIAFYRCEYNWPDFQLKIRSPQLFCVWKSMTFLINFIFFLFLTFFSF